MCRRADTIGPRSSFIQSCYQTPPPHQRREARIITDRHQLSGAPDTSGCKVREMLRRCRSHVLIKLIQWWIQLISWRQSPSLTGSIEADPSSWMSCDACSFYRPIPSPLTGLCCLLLTSHIRSKHLGHGSGNTDRSAFKAQTNPTKMEQLVTSQREAGPV